MSDPPPPVTLTWADFTGQFHTTTWKELTSRTVIILLAWVCMSAMLFGMNFMLDSFKDSRAASYTTLLSTAMAFFVNAIVLCAAAFIAAHTTECFASAKAAFRDVWQWRHIGQLFILGTVDALGGLTGTYAAPNTPIAAQFTIVATSVVWTFLFAKWLVPDRDRPCTPLVFIAVLLTVAGAAITIVPQWDSMRELRGVWSTVGWILIYILASIFPLVLNVLYSRYLVEHVDQNGRSVIIGAAPPGSDDDDTSSNGISLDIAAPAPPPPAGQHHHHHQSSAVPGSSSSKSKSNNWPYFVTRLSIALLGDALFQLVIILLLLPMDFCPWFGAASSSDQTAIWINEGFEDVFQGRSNPHTLGYFLVYVYGFLASHMIGASLSYYSPQLTAFIYSINTPMNLILLVLFPSWNVFSQHAPVWASSASIVSTAAGAVLYASWEHVQRLRASVTAMRVLPSNDEEEGKE